ncbi:MAG: hypothetical protein KAR62_00555, partial [Sphingomonadales bacterium]|nr:hypothetical protein [Sphingomonadales bacterium]
MNNQASDVPDASGEFRLPIAQEDPRFAPFFGVPDVPSIDRDQATGNPLIITPGPYLTPGTVEGDPFREEQLEVPVGIPVQTFYEDGNVFATEEVSDQDVLDVEGGASFELGIAMGQLAEIDPATLGLFEERTGGLPYNMWHDSTYDRVVDIISNLPVATPSPTINKLSELILLSAAAVPARQSEALSTAEAGPTVDAGKKAVNGLPEQSEQIEQGEQTEIDASESEVFNNDALLLARLMRLSETGKMSVLMNFMNALPQNISIAELYELRVNTALLEGDILSACNMAQDARAEEGATYWLKILTYCRAVDGDRAGVGFNISLLQETNEAPLFFTSLIEDILRLAEGRASGGSGVHSLSPSDVNALSIAMVNTAKGELPLYLLEDMPRLYLGSMTRRADLSIDFRAEVSELAALYGVMEGRVFSEVLEAMDFTDGERDSIFLLANTDLGARVDGLLINSAMFEGDRLRKAELISTAFERGLREKLYPALSYPLLDVVKTMTPTPDLAFFAHDAGRIALYSGDGVTAKKWYDLVLGMASAENFEASRSLVSLWPLMLMHDQAGAIPANEQIITLWRQSLNQLPAGEQQQRTELLYALLGVFQYDVPDLMLGGSFASAPEVSSSKMPP